MKPDIGINDLIAAMRERTGVAFCEADEWKAACVGLQRQVAVLKAEIAELKKPKEPSGEA